MFASGSEGGEEGQQTETVRSVTIRNAKKNPNFHDNVDIFDVWLPEKVGGSYWWKKFSKIPTQYSDSYFQDEPI